MANREAKLDQNELNCLWKAGRVLGDRDKVEARDWETANSGKLT